MQHVHDVVEVSEVRLDDVLSELSEESLFKLLQHVQARERRQVLKEDKQGDVGALRTLLQAVDYYHDQKLRSDADE